MSAATADVSSQDDDSATLMLRLASMGYKADADAPGTSGGISSGTENHPTNNAGDEVDNASGATKTGTGSQLIGSRAKESDDQLRMLKEGRREINMQSKLKGSEDHSAATVEGDRYFALFGEKKQAWDASRQANMEAKLAAMGWNTSGNAILEDDEENLAEGEATTVVQQNQAGGSSSSSSTAERNRKAVDQGTSSPVENGPRAGRNNENNNSSTSSSAGGSSSNKNTASRDYQTALQHPQPGLFVGAGGVEQADFDRQITSDLNPTDRELESSFRSETPPPPPPPELDSSMEKSSDILVAGTQQHKEQAGEDLLRGDIVAAVDTENNQNSDPTAEQQGHHHPDSAGPLVLEQTSSTEQGTTGTGNPESMGTTMQPDPHSFAQPATTTQSTANQSGGEVDGDNLEDEDQILLSSSEYKDGTEGNSMGGQEQKIDPHGQQHNMDESEMASQFIMRVNEFSERIVGSSGSPEEGQPLNKSLSQDRQQQQRRKRDPSNRSSFDDSAGSNVAGSNDSFEQHQRGPPRKGGRGLSRDDRNDDDVLDEEEEEDYSSGSLSSESDSFHDDDVLRENEETAPLYSFYMRDPVYNPDNSRALAATSTLAAGLAHDKPEDGWDDLTQQDFLNPVGKDYKNSSWEAERLARQAADNVMNMETMRELLDYGVKYFAWYVERHGPNSVPQGNPYSQSPPQGGGGPPGAAVAHQHQGGQQLPGGGPAGMNSNYPGPHQQQNLGPYSGDLSRAGPQQHMNNQAAQLQQMQQLAAQQNWSPQRLAQMQRQLALNNQKGGGYNVGAPGGKQQVDNRLFGAGKGGGPMGAGGPLGNKGVALGAGGGVPPPGGLNPAAIHHLQKGAAAQQQQQNQHAMAQAQAAYNAAMQQHRMGAAAGGVSGGPSPPPQNVAMYGTNNPAANPNLAAAAAAHSPYATQQAAQMLYNQAQQQRGGFQIPVREIGAAAGGQSGHSSKDPNFSVSTPKGGGQQHLHNGMNYGDPRNNMQHHHARSPRVDSARGHGGQHVNPMHQPSLHHLQQQQRMYSPGNSPRGGNKLASPRSPRGLGNPATTTVLPVGEAYTPTKDNATANPQLQNLQNPLNQIAPMNGAPGPPPQQQVAAGAPAGGNKQDALRNMLRGGANNINNPNNTSIIAGGAAGPGHQQHPDLGVQKTEVPLLPLGSSTRPSAAANGHGPSQTNINADNGNNINAARTTAGAASANSAAGAAAQAQLPSGTTATGATTTRMSGSRENIMVSAYDALHEQLQKAAEQLNKSNANRLSRNSNMNNGGTTGGHQPQMPNHQQIVPPGPPAGPPPPEDDYEVFPARSPPSGPHVPSVQPPRLPDNAVHNNMGSAQEQRGHNRGEVQIMQSGGVVGGTSSENPSLHLDLQNPPPPPPSSAPHPDMSPTSERDRLLAAINDAQKVEAQRKTQVRPDTELERMTQEEMKAEVKRLGQAVKRLQDGQQIGGPTHSPGLGPDVSSRNNAPYANEADPFFLQSSRSNDDYFLPPFPSYEDAEGYNNNFGRSSGHHLAGGGGQHQSSSGINNRRSGGHHHGGHHHDRASGNTNKQEKHNRRDYTKEERRRLREERDHRRTQMRMQQAGQDAAALGGQIDPEMNPLGPNGEPLYARPTREQDTRDLHDRRGGGPRGGGRGGAEHQPGRAGDVARDQHLHDRNNTMMRGSGGQQQYNQNVEQTTGRAARGDREQNYRDHDVEPHQQPPRQRGSRGVADHTYDQTGAAGPSTRGDGHRRGHQMREDDRRQHNMREDRGSRGGVDQHGRSYNSGDPRNTREQGQHSNRGPPDEYDYDYDHRIRMEQEHDRNIRRREQRDRDHRGGPPDHGGQHATRGEQQGMNMGEHQQQRRGDQNHRERRRADRDQHGRGGGDQNISNRDRGVGQQPPPMYNDPRAAGGSRGGPDRGMDHAREQLQRRGDHVDHHRDRVENHPSTTSRSGGPPGYGVIGDNAYQEQQTTGTTRGQRGSNRDRGGGNNTNDPRGEVGRRSDPRIQAATSQEMMRQSGGGDQAGLYNQVGGGGGPPPPEQSSHRRGDRDRRENANRGDRGNDRRHHNRGGGDRGGNNDRGQPFDWTPPVRPANEVQ